MVGWVLAISTANLASATPSTSRWPPSVRTASMRPASAQRRTVSTLTPRSSAAWPILYVGMGRDLSAKAAFLSTVPCWCGLRQRLFVRHHGDRMHDIAHKERRRVDHADVPLRVEDLEIIGVRRFDGLSPVQPGDLQLGVGSEEPVPAGIPLGGEVRADELRDVCRSAIGDNADDEQNRVDPLGERLLHGDDVTPEER